MFYQKAILALAPALPATFAFPTHGPTVRSDSVGLNARDGSNDVFNLKGPCADNSKLWASPHAIGGGLPGTESCETHFAAGSDYSPVTGVTAWLKGTGDKIAGIQLTYASGEQSDVYGTADTSKNPTSSITLAAGETFKDCILYGDGNGHFLGHIHLETNKGQTMDAGTSTSGKNPYNIDVGSGIMTGMQVSTGSDNPGENDIIYGAFLFLGQPVDHVEVSNIRYTANPNGSVDGIQPNSILVGTWYNNLDINSTYNNSPQHSVEKSHTFKQSTTSTFSLSEEVKITAGIPLLGDVEATTKVGWELSETTEQDQTDKVTDSLTCAASGSIPPHSGVKVSGSYSTGKGDFDYDSDVEVFLKDGSSYKYSEKGSLNSVGFTDCQVSIEPNNDAKTSNTNSLTPASKRDLAGNSEDTTSSGGTAGFGLLGML